MAADLNGPVMGLPGRSSVARRPPSPDRPEGEGAAVELDELARDRQAEAVSGRRLVDAAAERHHMLGLSTRESRAIVLDVELDTGVAGRSRDEHAAPGPLAGIVEKVAHHLVEVLPLASDGQAGA